MVNERSRLFGSDLQIGERAAGLDLLTASGDLAVAAGNDNIVQALALRLRVRQGELARLGWADYGSRLHELIGEPNNTRTHVKLMAFARTAIEQDPRVAEVSAIESKILPGEGNVVRLLLEISLIEAPDPLNLVFDVKLN